MRADDARRERAPAGWPRAVPAEQLVLHVRNQLGNHHQTTHVTGARSAQANRPPIDQRPRMSPPEIRSEILDILSDIAPDEDLSPLADDKPFREQLELDSMDFLDIVMELRKRHRIQIPEADYQHLASLASTVAYLEPRMR